MAIYVWDQIIDNLQSSFEGIDGGADAASTVNQNSASGQPNIYLASLTGFEVGKSVAIDMGESDEESKIVSSLGADHLVLSRNLENSHLAVDTHVVKQDWYNFDVSRVTFWPAGPPPWSGDAPEIAIADDKKTNMEAVFASKTRYWRNVGVSMVVPLIGVGKTGKEISRLIEDVIHDLTRAILTDHSRGGWAKDTKIQEMAPYFPDGGGLLGVETMLSIHYSHRHDDTARLI